MIYRRNLVMARAAKRNLFFGSRGSGYVAFGRTHTHTDTHKLGTAKRKQKRVKKSGQRELLRSCGAVPHIFVSVEEWMGCAVFFSAGGGRAAQAMASWRSPLTRRHSRKISRMGQQGASGPHGSHCVLGGIRTGLTGGRSTGPPGQPAFHFPGTLQRGPPKWLGVATEIWSQPDDFCQ